jgi:hypothetical protein
MNTGRSIFSQLMDFLPLQEFHRCVDRYSGDYKIQRFSCLDQFLTLAFAQVTRRESLRDIEGNLRVMQSQLYHLGFRGRISRNTLAHANEVRDWRIYADFAQILMAIARELYCGTEFVSDLQTAVYALDATTIDLCLSLFPWAHFRQKKGAIKVHTLLDVRHDLPSFLRITDGRTHEVKVLDEIELEWGAFYLLDRGYLDFSRLFIIHRACAYFVTRAKRNLSFQRFHSYPLDRAPGLRSDQLIVLRSYYPARHYPQPLRRIGLYDYKSRKYLIFLTNNTALPALAITQLYQQRWRIELFFKWIKQHLHIKKFYGTSENAVKIQIWVAVSVYLLVAIAKKRFGIDLSLNEMLQILSLHLFDKIPIFQAFTKTNYTQYQLVDDNQLSLFKL